MVFICADNAGVIVNPKGEMKGTSSNFYAILYIDVVYTPLRMPDNTQIHSIGSVYTTLFKFVGTPNEMKSCGLCEARNEIQAVNRKIPLHPLWRSHAQPSKPALF